MTTHHTNKFYLTNQNSLITEKTKHTAPPEKDRDSNSVIIVVTERIHRPDMQFLKHYNLHLITQCFQISPRKEENKIENM